MTHVGQCRHEELPDMFARENPCVANLPQIKVQDLKEVTEEVVTTTLRRGLNFYSTIQAHDGHWPGDYGGPMFLLPGLVITLYITGALNVVLSIEHQREMCRYLFNHSGKIIFLYFGTLKNEDGGWGLHIEGPSTMFGTVLSYVTLRLLGEGRFGAEGVMEKGRKWILDHGGATAITSWGKMWLFLLGAYEWSGNNPLPPEVWLCPYILPIHPGRDVVSLPNGVFAHVVHIWEEVCWSNYTHNYFFEKGAVHSPLSRSRLESSPQSMCQVADRFYVNHHWDFYKFLSILKHTGICKKIKEYLHCEEDLYYPHSLVQDILWASLHKVLEPILGHWPGNKLREKALCTVMQHVHYEDENTRYICIGPVNKVLNMLCCWIEDPNSEAFKLHIPRIFDYLWIAEDGMKMQGYNGSQLWDTSFAVQAIISTNLGEEYGLTLRKAHEFIKNSQVHVAIEVLEDCPGDLKFWYRHISKVLGHSQLLIMDGRSLIAVLLLSKLSLETVGEPLDMEQLFDAVNVILSLQVWTY
ncbi:Cycloartenol Synthase [Vitis vinifera]|uniref:Cycloartenol Synthase n=1 Tax=Vitis vinifera TaxID=29760 RepID=A0A438E531_VITVI|nr:Cycloartenol Synthase [Vitis vinifera]